MDRPPCESSFFIQVFLPYEEQRLRARIGQGDDVNGNKRVGSLSVPSNSNYEHSKLTEPFAMLQNDETGLRDCATKLKDEKTEFEDLVADLAGERKLLVSLSSVPASPYIRNQRSGKAKRLLHANKSAASGESLHIQ